MSERVNEILERVRIWISDLFHPGRQNQYRVDYLLAVQQLHSTRNLLEQVSGENAVLRAHLKKDVMRAVDVLCHGAQVHLTGYGRGGLRYYLKNEPTSDGDRIGSSDPTVDVREVEVSTIQARIFISEASEFRRFPVLDEKMRREFVREVSYCLAKSFSDKILTMCFSNWERG